MECSQPAALTSNRSLLVAPVSRLFQEDRRIRIDLTQSCTPRRRRFFSVTGVVDPALHIQKLLLRAGEIELNLGPICSSCSSQFTVTPHPSSARPASGTSTEPAVASSDRKRVFKTLSASSVPGVLLHHLVYNDRHQYQLIATPTFTLSR